MGQQKRCEVLWAYPSPARATGCTTRFEKPLRLGDLEIGRCRLATLGHGLERDPLAFAQGRQAGGLHGTDMNEHVFRTVLWLDETEAFCGIEDLNFADGHSGLLIKYLGMTPRTGNHPKARANRRMSFANAQARRQPIAKANISSALVGQIGRKSNAFLERAVACG